MTDKDLIDHTVSTIGNFIKSTEKAKPVEKPENFVHLYGNTYYVRTQAGFRKALKIHSHDKDNYDNHPIVMPKEFFYPAVVTFSVAYRGFFEMTVVFQKPEPFKANLQRVIDVIEDSDDKYIAYLAAK